MKKGEEKGEFLDKFKLMGTFIGKREEHIKKYLFYNSTFRLKREPENEYDKNAIMVQLSVRKGAHFLDLGYVPKDKAAIWAPMIDTGEKLKTTFRVCIINEKTGKFIACYLNMLKEK